MNGIYFELFGRRFAWLNNWYSPDLAIAYYVWMSVAFLGVLQVAAALHRREDIAWIPDRRARLIVGLLIWSAAFGIFYVTQYRLIFVPGPASTEALVLLGAAGLTAILVTRVLSWSTSAVHAIRSDDARDADVAGEA